MKALVISLSILAIAASSPAAEHPNIILVMADDHGWGDAGYHGDPLETTDLSKDPTHRERFETMKKKLDAWMRSVIRSLNGGDYR